MKCKNCSQLKKEGNGQKCIVDGLSVFLTNLEHDCEYVKDNKLTIAGKKTLLERKL